ncbi:MAG: FAD-dependent oxidoreductase [Firmicutes bacterium]|nr:FAD-dependent oxidoreductase [Bacillota bacterium]
MTADNCKKEDYLQNLPPCQVSCPIHQEVREYLRLIAMGDFDRSLEAIKRANPLSSVCGTICAHHCEDECRRANVDEALSIRGLKRAAVEFGKAGFPDKKETDPEKKVAVVGSGPAGLMAAFKLALQGCAVTVLEKEDDLGGAPRQYIPLYRLPDETVDLDINHLKALGIEFKTRMELGKDFSLDDLKNEGYKAILLALGLTASRGLPLPGADHKDVLMALTFLKASKRDGFRLDGKEVIVIGGGNVAMDVARSAVRCGATKVRLACLESAEEMPAFPWEIEEAREEGVEMNCSWGPKEILIEDDKIVGLKLVRCTSVFDEQGRFNPCYGDEYAILPGDTVIFAIGQASDLSTAVKGGVQADERGRLVFDPQTLKTPLEGVFACGEVATGPGTAVQSMAHGRLGALAVANYLEGKPFLVSMEEQLQPLPQLAPEVAQEVKRIKRHPIPGLSPQERATNFKPVEKGYTLAMAVHESMRCLGCAAGAKRVVELCADCLTCLRSCPYGVPVVSEEGDVNIRVEQCQTCGLCLTVCPNMAIEFRTPYIEEAASGIEEAVKEALKGKNGLPAVVALCCGYGSYALPEFRQEFLSQKPANLGVVRFPCISKIDTIHILKAFELGAEGVLVAGCHDEEGLCPFQKTMFWAEKRVGKVKGILKDVGYNPDCLELVSLTPQEVANFKETAENFAKKVKELEMVGEKEN